MLGWYLGGRATRRYANVAARAGQDKIRPVYQSTAMIPRVNPFLRPLPAWVRDFKDLRPVALTQASAYVFGAPIRTDIMHRVVHWYRASIRAGTASTKHRSDVAGSTRKLYRQKGSGRARAGSIRAPQRRGGARCFGPKPRSYYYTLPEKLRNLGLRSALSAKFKQGQLTFIKDETLALNSHKTKELATVLSHHPAKKTLVLDTQQPSENLRLASRSLGDRLVFMNACDKRINVYHILNNSMVILTERAKLHLERRFASAKY